MVCREPSRDICSPNFSQASLRQLDDSEPIMSVKIKDPDDILRLLGNPGKFQIIQYILLSFQILPCAFTDMVPLFYNLNPVGIDTTENKSIAGHGNFTPLRQLLSSPGCDAAYVHRKDRNYSFVYAGAHQWSIIGEVRPLWAVLT